ncbi:hypothetical protein M0805_003976 [Coniferiporia weirii]|nr:hypothetical protein M0805_003976 [Coniferiporia weirii]
MSDRVLSVQSHVAYGYVGGKAAVFPLQCLGFDVDVVNTVNFSNHSGYGRFGGSRTTSQDFTTIFNIMETNGLLSQRRLLTGYIPGAEALSVIADLARKLKSNNPELIYLLDPVLGDSGKLYVAPDVIPIYREILPLATIITPNWFEIETLTNTIMSDMHSLRRALRILHEEYHVPHVVMSSMPLRDFLRDLLPAHLLPGDVDTKASLMQSHLICISSSYIAPSATNSDHGVNTSQKGISTVHAHVLPCIPGYFSGVGDLFSALVLAHFHETSPASTAHTPLSLAVSQALSKTLAIVRLTRTHAAASPVPPAPPVADDATDEEKDLADPERRVRRQRARELRLVQGQDILRAAPSPSAPPDSTKAAELREMRVWADFWVQAPDAVR